MAIAVILACILAGLAALVGVCIQAVRHGPKYAWGWPLLPLGALLMFGLIPATIGYLERVWSLSNPTLWGLVATGLLGVWCQVAGWRSILHPPPRPGHCPECGYDLQNLGRCPECGRAPAA